MRMSISKKAYIKIRELGLIPGSLFRIELLCYSLNPLEYVFLVVANCASIPTGRVKIFSHFSLQALA